ncbi:unnamed protein product, partial [Chrysoparadoxa australica]
LQVFLGDQHLLVGRLAHTPSNLSTKGPRTCRAPCRAPSAGGSDGAPYPPKVPQKQHQGLAWRILARVAPAVQGLARVDRPDDLRIAGLAHGVLVAGAWPEQPDLQHLQA